VCVVFGRISMGHLMVASFSSQLPARRKIPLEAAAARIATVAFSANNKKFVTVLNQ